MQSRALGISLLLFCFGSLAAAQSACSFSLFQVPNTSTMPNAINRDGVIVGMAVKGGGTASGFIRSAEGRLSTYDAPNSIMTNLQGINSAGVKVGVFEDMSNAVHSFALYKNNFVEIKVPGAPFTWTSGINDHGDIVGAFATPEGFDGFLLRNKKFKTIHFPGAQATFANGINDFGVIVGWYLIINDSQQQEVHGFVLANGRFFRLDAGPFTSLNSINNAGEIAGVYVGDQPTAFTYQNGKFSSFSVPNADGTGAYGVNANGILTGTAQFGGSFSGFVGSCAAPTASPRIHPRALGGFERARN